MRHIAAGIVLLGFGAWGMVGWWDSFAHVMRGLIPFGLLAFGLVALLSGYRRFGEAVVGRDEETGTRER